MPTKRAGGRISSDTIKSYDRSRFAGVVGPGRIVIGTDGGVFWSEIPIATTDVGSYAWIAAAGLPSGACVSLVPGPRQQSRCCGRGAG